MLQHVGTLLFVFAVLHTFFVSRIYRQALRFPKGSFFYNLFHILGEIELVFALWAIVLLIFMATLAPELPLEHLQSLHFAEPIFVFCIMVVAASRPVLWGAEKLIEFLSLLLQKFLKVPAVIADVFVVLVVGPLSGSFITEPAAMTVSALLLVKIFPALSQRLLYFILAVLFVNVSIGGALTPYAAPPILMVAKTWSWDFSFMMANFALKSAVAVFLNALLLVFYFKKDIQAHAKSLESDAPLAMPKFLVFAHYIFLCAVVVAAHNPVAALAIVALFAGGAYFTKEYQDPLRYKESALVAIFLAGIIVFGPLQRWWLEPLIAQFGGYTLYLGAVALTAVTDNAALTYLGAQVPTISDASKYLLVAGALAGGGLTVIANAPNAAGLAILSNRFTAEGFAPMKLLKAALIPTLVAVLCLAMM